MYRQDINYNNVTFFVYHANIVVWVLTNSARTEIKCYIVI